MYPPDSALTENPPIKSCIMVVVSSESAKAFRYLFLRMLQPFGNLLPGPVIICSINQWLLEISQTLKSFWFLWAPEFYCWPVHSEKLSRSTSGAPRASVIVIPCTWLSVISGTAGPHETTWKLSPGNSDINAGLWCNRPEKIGEEITEILDFTPGKFYVKQYIRPKFVRPVSETNDPVIAVSLPGRRMKKCMACEVLVTQIMVDKYMDHLPLHRLLQRFARMGLIIAQSTNGWVKNGLLLLVGSLRIT